MELKNRILLPFFMMALFILLAGAAGGAFAQACSAYQGNTSWGGISGGNGSSGSGNMTGYVTTINEYYFGNAANFVELTATNLSGDGTSPAASSIWGNWAVSITSKAGKGSTTVSANVNQSAVTACYEGQTTYFWIPASAFGLSSLPSNPQVMLWEDQAKTQAIDMFAWQNPGTLPLTLYNSNICPNLTSTANTQTIVGQPYQTEFAPSSLGNKGMVRVPNLTGNWIVSGSSNGPAASGTTPVISGNPVTGTIAPCTTSPNNGGIAINKALASAVAQPVIPGTTIPFSITVTNNTATTQSVSVSDSLPAGLSYNIGSAAPAPASLGPPLSWTTAPLAAQSTATITFSATVDSNVPDGSALINTASAPLPSSTLTATSSAGIANVANPLTIAKTVSCSTSPCAVGSTLTFTVTVTNKQNPAPTSITVSDVMPSQLTWTVTPSTGAYNTATGVWTITGLPGASLNGTTTATLQAVATVPPAVGGTTITNNARITAVSPAEPNLVLPSSPASASMYVQVQVSGFDAVEVAAPRATSIFTKLAGTAFSLDVLALDNSNNLATAYSGTTNIQLVDAGTGGGVCANMAVLQDYGNFTAFSSGRKTITLTYANAARNARIRIIDATAAVTACSTDNFSIRPTSFTAVTSNITNTATSGTPKAVAGSGNFSLTAATGLTNYNGTPKIGTAVQAHSGALQNGTVSGIFSAAVSGTASGSAFTYSEVGNFRLKGSIPSIGDNAARGVIDDTFTSVDQPNDCTPDFSNTLSGGKYGCKFGIVADTGYFGRFYPASFLLTPVSVINRRLAGCSPASGFTYAGEEFQTTFKLTAQNGASVPAATLNYDPAAGFAKFDGAVSTNFNFGAIDLADATPPVSAYPLTTLLNPVSSSGNWSAGVGTFTTNLMLNRTAAPSPNSPYESFSVGIAPVDADGVSLNSYNLDTDVPSNGNDRGLVATTKIRYGYLAIANSYGSELLPLPVSVIAKYWNGTGYITNTDDSCTSLASANFNQAPSSGGIINTTILGSSSLSAGKGQITLTKPTGYTTKGSVDVSTNILYLQYKAGRETFGIRRGGPVIYMREIY